MKIHPIVAHNSLDNVFYILEYGNKQAITIDPPETKLCQDFLNEHSLQLEKVFVTHEHWDHYEGVEGLNCSDVYASQIATEAMPISVSHIISDEEIFFEYEDIKIKSIATPGHAAGHMMFEVSQDDTVTAILSGDALFPGGVGHTRRGSSEELYASIEKFEKYSDGVMIYSGHDYMENNISFIRKYFPERESILDEMLEKRRERIYFTNLGEERKYNPFLGVDKKEFIRIRELRNNY